MVKLKRRWQKAIVNGKTSRHYPRLVGGLERGDQAMLLHVLEMTLQILIPPLATTRLEEIVVESAKIPYLAAEEEVIT